MRILLIGRSLPFHRVGGMEAVAWDLAREFAVHGHTVDLLTTSASSLPEISSVEGVEIRSLPVPPGRYSPAWWSQSAKAYGVHYDGKVDVVLGVGAGAYSVLDRYGGGKAGTPFVMQVHGTSWSELKSKLAVPTPLSWASTIKNAAFFLKDRRYRRFNHLVAIGDAVKDQLCETPTRWWSARTPITVISNGVSEPNFAFAPQTRSTVRADLGFGAGDFVVLSAGRLHPQKGLDLGVAGFARALKQAPRLRYLIAGDGPDEARLRSLVEAAGIGERVRFTGALNRTQLAETYSAADAFLFTSVRVEGLPVAPLEALAAGLPCIMSSHLVEDSGLPARGVQPRQDADVAQAILDVARQADGPRRSLLPERFTLAHSAASYERLFAELTRSVA